MSAPSDTLPVEKSRFQVESSERISVRTEPDVLAVEEPLEIRAEGRSVAVVMRTPGQDRELVAGFLVTEGVVRRASDLIDLSRCNDAGAQSRANIMEAMLRHPDEGALDKLSRHVFSASSCGICGKATIESIFGNFAALESALTMPACGILGLPAKAAAAQTNFAHTGGIHASAMFDAGGALLCLREDVGRHNALDKVIGWGLLEERLPLSECVLLVSGRVSFELMQKALAGGIPIVAGISAPSSLAVEFARSSGQTLVGFLRPGGFNLYAGKGIA